MCSAPADSGRAMQQDGRAYRDLVLAAVWQDGMALRYASEELQADREIVLAAVRQDGMALCFASEELQADREIVLAAVQQDGRALCFASAELQAEPDLVLAAVRQDGRALDYASVELLADLGGATVELMAGQGGAAGDQEHVDATRDNEEDAKKSMAVADATRDAKMKWLWEWNEDGSVLLSPRAQNKTCP